MGTSTISALLVNAPVSRHFAQLHRDSESRAASVGLYIESGLRRGNPVLVVASEENAEQYLQGMRAAGLDHEAYRRSGQFRMLDARAVLAQFMRGELPDWTSFRRVVGGTIESMEAFAQHSAVRVYGEMVNVLWHEGNAAGAIRLEQFWNELARLHPFCLFCTYMLECEHAHAYAGPLHEIGREHTDIVLTESDAQFEEAVDAASRDVFGVPLTGLIGKANIADHPGEEKLPPGQRTMLWIMRNMPGSSAKVLERARVYFTNPRNGTLEQRR